MIRLIHCRVRDVHVSCCKIILESAFSTIERLGDLKSIYSRCNYIISGEVAAIKRYIYCFD